MPPASSSNPTIARVRQSPLGSVIAERARQHDQDEPGDEEAEPATETAP
jgi:hypothetical protein